jgi:hypothetical protein
MPAATSGAIAPRRVQPTPLGGIGLVLVAVLGIRLAVVPAAAETKAYESDQFHYSVALPAGCRYEEGPGTLDAVCSPELDSEKSKAVSTALALILEVSVELVADDASREPADLAQRYDEAQFKAELPEAVCGEPDRARVKIEGAKQVLEAARVVYTASIACPEIRFLGLGERRASVRYLITPGLRYRLTARAPTDDFEQRKEAVDAFFASFRLLREGKKSQ